MKLHHFGYVFSSKKIKSFKRKYNYIIDTKQNNYIFFNFSKKYKIWFEFLIPINNKSTVYNYLLKNKNKNNIHHYGFIVKNIIATEKQMKNNGFILIGKYKLNVPCFGGLINTAFFFNGKNLIEILSNGKK